MLSKGPATTEPLVLAFRSRNAAILLESRQYPYPSQWPAMEIAWISAASSG